MTNNIDSFIITESGLILMNVLYESDDGAQVAQFQDIFCKVSSGRVYGRLLMSWLSVRELSD